MCCFLFLFLSLSLSLSPFFFLRFTAESGSHWFGSGEEHLCLQEELGARERFRIEKKANEIESLRVVECHCVLEQHQDEQRRDWVIMKGLVNTTWQYITDSALPVSSGTVGTTCFNFSEADVASSGCAFKLSGLYVTPPVTFRHSIGLIIHTFQRVRTQGHSQSIIDTASRPSGNHGYILNPGRS